MMKTKNKNNLRFPIERRGYSREAVESWIALEGAKTDEIQLEQRERVNALKAENDALKLQVETLKGREEQIKLALVSATQNADRLSEDVKRRYKQELERLRLFRAKWLGAYEQMRERYHFDKDALNVESVAVSVEMELKKFLSQDFSLNKCVSEDMAEAHFRREAERLTALQFDAQREDKAVQAQKSENSDVATKGDALAQKLKEAEGKRKGRGSAAYTLDDALNPTNTLEENIAMISHVVR